MALAGMRGDLLARPRAVSFLDLPPAEVSLFCESERVMAKRNRKLDDQTEQEIIAEFKSGLACVKIARKHGITWSLTRSVLQRAGLSIRQNWAVHRAYKGPSEISPELASEVLEFYLKRPASIEQTAERFGISPRRVKTIIGQHQRGRGRLDRVTSDVVAEIVRLRKAGETILRIQKAVKLTKKTVCKYLSRHYPDGLPGIASGERHWSWRGGRLVTNQDYVLVLISRDHPFYEAMRIKTMSSPYVLEHRFVMAELLGRPLLPHETVHHINGARNDNRPENLQLRIGKHGVGAVFICGDCGSKNIKPMPLADTSEPIGDNGPRGLLDGDIT
jgi:transposase-like protein